MAVIARESFLQKLNLVKKKKSKNVNMNAIYIIIFLKKKKTKGVNMRVKSLETIPNKKKTQKASICS